MNRSVRTLVGVILPALTIAVFIVLLAFSLLRLAGIERDMRIEASQNMLWVISRAHVASLQLSKAAARHTADETGRSALALRYNVFLSRVALLYDGPQRRQMEDLGFADALDSFRRDMPELDVLVTDRDRVDIQRVDALLEPYNDMLGQAANKAMIAEWDSLGGRLDSSRAQLWQIIVSLLGIALAGAVLLIHFIMAIRDARERTRLLNKEKAFSQLLIGSSGEGIVAVDLDRRCTVWNDAAGRLFDRSANTIIGRTLGDVSGFFQIDRIAQAIDESLEGQPAALFDQPFFPSGQSEPRYVDLHCFSLRDGARIIGSILLVSDVTERRATQQEITDHRDHLEQLVHARTQELDAALTRERATAELYRNFGAMISHQFRTPLAVVDSALQRLMRRSDRLSPAEVLERGGKARQAIARLIKLVESTLDAARLDAGQIEIASQPCDLGLLAREVCARQAEQSSERRITVALPQGRSAIAHCDPVHAENILINLLSNAVKYSPAGSAITVTVRTTEHDIECAVRNQGALASPAERGALFERYFRGSNAEGRPGIGIGLYMAKTLARMQSGDVQLADDSDGQITFTLILPRADALSADSHRPALASETR